MGYWELPLLAIPYRIGVKYRRGVFEREGTAMDDDLEQYGDVNYFEVGSG